MSEFDDVTERFRQAMVEKLEENAHKGGWSDESPRWLLTRVEEELVELRQAVDAWNAATHRGYPDDICEARRRKVLREAADVANFALMVADVCGALEDT